MSQPAKIVTACIVVIGNEILSGRTRDANIAYLATELGVLGVRVMECRIIADVEATIVATINEVRKKFDYVFTTGGIGPTHDDITADSIAKAFGVGISEHPEAVARMTRHYGDPALFTPARRRMARVPHGGTLVDNPVSVAPGFQMENVFTFAGIPKVAEAMFQSMKHRLVGGDPVLSRSVRTNLPEGIIAEPLGALHLHVGWVGREGGVVDDPDDGTMTGRPGRDLGGGGAHGFLSPPREGVADHGRRPAAPAAPRQGAEQRQGPTASGQHCTKLRAGTARRNRVPPGRTSPRPV